MDPTRMDELDKEWVEIGGVDGFLSIMAGIDVESARRTDELWALTEGGLNCESPTDAEGAIIWDDELTHEQKVKKLRAMRSERRAQKAGNSKVVPIRLS